MLSETAKRWAGLAGTRPQGQSRAKTAEPHGTNYSKADTVPCSTIWVATESLSYPENGSITFLRNVRTSS
jgi:hypothetical protein